MVSFRKIAAASFFAVTLSSPVAANVIHFTGEIVEPPCTVSPDAHRLSVSCPHNNSMSTQQVNYKEALSGTVNAADRATISMKYLNPEKSLAVVQVDYP